MISRRFFMVGAAALPFAGKAAGETSPATGGNVSRGHQAIAIGSQSLEQCTSGSGNIAIGRQRAMIEWNGKPHRLNIFPL